MTIQGVFGQATGSSTPQGYQEITLDLEKQKFDQPFPFDVPFYVCGTVPNSAFPDAKLESIIFYIAKDHQTELWENNEVGNINSSIWTQIGTWENRNFSTENTKKDFCILFPPLPSDQAYTLAPVFRTFLSETKKGEVKTSIDQLLSRELQGVFSYHDNPQIAKRQYPNIANLIWEELEAAKNNACYEKLSTRSLCSQTSLSKAGIETQLTELDFDWRSFLSLTQDFIVSYQQRDRAAQKSLQTLKTVYPDCLKALFRNADYASLTEGERLKNQLSQLNSVLASSQRFVITSGQTNLGKFPEIIGTKPEISSPSSLNDISILIQNLEAVRSSLQQILESFNLEILLEKKKRHAVFFPKAANGAIARAEVENISCMLASIKVQADPLKIDEVDTAVLEQIKSFLTQLKIVQNHFVSVKSSLENLEKVLNQFAATRAQIINPILENLVYSVAMVQPMSSHTDFQTRGKYFITADAGFTYIPNMQSFYPYLGVNFSLGPLNRERKYSVKDFFETKDGNFYYECIDHPFWYHLRKNTSIIVGVVPFDIAQGNASVNNFWSNTGNDNLQKINFLTGVGMRVSDGIRLSGGLIWMRQADGNPLVSPTAIQTFGYGSLSLDLDLGKYANRFLGIAFPGQTFK